MWPSAWHCKHCTEADLSIHFQIVTSFLKRAVLSFVGMLMIVLSGLETANVIVEYNELILLMGFSNLDSIARCTFF